jgi:hypothetical protein
VRLEVSMSIALNATLHITWLALTQWVTGPLTECCTHISEAVIAGTLPTVRYKLHELMVLLEVRHKIAPEQWEPELAALGEAGCVRLAEACGVFDAALEPALALAEAEAHMQSTAAQSPSASTVAPVPLWFPITPGVPVSTHYRPLTGALQTLAQRLGYRVEVRVEKRLDQTALTLEPAAVDVAPIRAIVPEEAADRAIGRRLVLVATTLCAGAFRRAESEVSAAQSIASMVAHATREVQMSCGVVPC